MDIIALLGTAAMLTLAVVCLMLALPVNQRLFLVTGRTVFGWLFVALFIFVLTRFLTLGFNLPTEAARNINSVAFMLAVGGIILNVIRHVLKTDKG